jgi:hypothetical protein
MLRYLFEVAMKPVEYKPGQGSFDLTLSEKAIANRTERAHGKAMRNNGAGEELFAKGISA